MKMTPERKLRLVAATVFLLSVPFALWLGAKEAVMVTLTLAVLMLLGRRTVIESVTEIVKTLCERKPKDK